MKKYRKNILIMLFLITFLAGCGEKAGKTLEQMPDDTPWNTGFTAIMETEDGYYYNIGYLGDTYERLRQPHYMNLRYYDKATQTSVMLCNKPECTHTNPETCVAIYKNLVVLGSLLYDDAIYVYGLDIEDKIYSFNLYRIATDGSALDKVGTAFSVENTLGKEYEIVPENWNVPAETGTGFIIHKGYAFLPYRMQVGIGSSGFLGGGLVKMNILTGECETIYKGEYKTSMYPYGMMGCDDYVYIRFSGYLNSEMKRYSMTQGTLEYIAQPDPETVKIFQQVGIKIGPIGCATMWGEYLYSMGVAEEEEHTQCVDVLSKENGEYLPTRFFTTRIPEEEYVHGMVAYREVMVIITSGEVHFYSLSEGDTYGSFLGKIAFCPEDDRAVDVYDTFKISNGKLYQINRPLFKDRKPNQDGEYYEYYSIQSCPIADILEGKGEWNAEFTFENCR